jgi:hypothetical protein
MAFGPIESCGLLWRWTLPSHAEFPPQVMAVIRPFTPAEALKRHNEGMARVPSTYANADARVDCGDGTSEGEVSDWLLSLSSEREAWTVLTWDQTTAVLLPWAVFAERWSDFCYPSSDDVTIW